MARRRVGFGERREARALARVPRFDQVPDLVRQRAQVPVGAVEAPDQQHEPPHLVDLFHGVPRLKELAVHPPQLAQGDGPVGVYRRWCKQFYPSLQSAAPAE